MKKIIKTMTFMVIVILLLHCDYYDPIDLDPIANVDIPDTKINIPDLNFLNALIERGFDTNGDHTIGLDEAERIIHLDISDENIYSLRGIEAFRNLVTLDCHSNNISMLDLSKNYSLENLSCQNNHIVFLEIYKNSALKKLRCSENPLFYLILDYNTALKKLWSSACGLTSVNLSHNPALTDLDLGLNRLVYLDLSNNANLEYVSLNDMPSLHEVCVSEMSFPPSGVDIDTINSPNVYFATDCYYNSDSLFTHINF
jgi:hypothetical protein